MQNMHTINTLVVWIVSILASTTRTTYEYSMHRYYELYELVGCNGISLQIILSPRVISTAYWLGCW